MIEYGIAVNGYVYNEDGEISLWIQKRSLSSLIWPKKLDNFVSGSISTKYSAKETACYSAEKGANMPTKISRRLGPVGYLGTFYQFKDELIANVTFIYDIELPYNYQPTNLEDKENEFRLVPASKILEMLCDEAHLMVPKTRNILFDFLIRKEVLDLENEPDLPEIIDCLQIPVHGFYEAK